MTFFTDLIPALEEAEHLASKHRCRYAVVDVLGGYKVVPLTSARLSRVLEICRP